MATAFIFTNNCTAGTPVQFSGVGVDLSYTWDFGDGTTSTEHEPAHIYENPGVYLATLTTPNVYAEATVTVVGAEASGQTLFMPLSLISDERYADIVIRDLKSSWPTKLYDSGSYPVRTIRVWPVPQQQYAVELWMWQPLATYATLDDELNLPPGYERYLRFKLAVEIAPEFGKEVGNSVKLSLNEAEASIKRLNQQLPVGESSVSGAALQQRNHGRRF